MSVLFDWKIQDIERTANECKNRLWELDALRRDVGSLEYTMRETRAEIDGLRRELETAKNELIDARELLCVLSEEGGRRKEGGNETKAASKLSETSTHQTQAEKMGRDYHRTWTPSDDEHENPLPEP